MNSQAYHSGSEFLVHPQPFGHDVLHDPGTKVVILGREDLDDIAELDTSAFASDITATAKELEVLIDELGFTLGVRSKLGKLATQLLVATTQAPRELETTSHVWFNLPENSYYIHGIATRDDEKGKKWPYQTLYVAEQIIRATRPPGQRAIATARVSNYASLRLLTECNYRGTYSDPQPCFDNKGVPERGGPRRIFLTKELDYSRYGYEEEVVSELPLPQGDEDRAEDIMRKNISHELNLGHHLAGVKPNPSRPGQYLASFAISQDIEIRDPLNK